MTLSDTIALQSGIEPAQAGEVLRILALFGIVDPDTVIRAERDARIYELRAEMTAMELAERFGMTERRIYQVVKVQTRIRQAV